MATKEDIKKILLLLSVLPNNALREDNLELAIEAYHLVLKDLDWQTLESAAGQYLSTSTFFPTPGNLREAAMDVLLSAQGIPSPTEAWADVLTASRMVPASFCHTGTDLLLDAVEYLDAGDIVRFIHILKKSILHDSTCSICCLAHREEVYCHPFVELTVNRLGGYDALFSGDPSTAEARFLEAYETLLDEQQKKGAAQLEPACGGRDDRHLLIELEPGKWLCLPAPPCINTTLN